MVSKNIRKAIRRGHWVTVVQSVLYLAFIVFIIVLEFAYMDDFTDFALPSLSSFMRW